MKNSRLLLAFLSAVILATGAYVFVWRAKGPQPPSGSPILRARTANGSSEQAVLAAYKLLEKAAQTGDGNLFLSLHSEAGLDEAGKQAREQIRKGFPPNPAFRCEVLSVKVGSDHAAVLGKITGAGGAPQYHLAKFVLENGSWKIALEAFQEKPFAAAVLEAAVPPNDGAFKRAGCPWNKIPYAAANLKWFKPDQIDWKMQATQDKSFLYLRFEAKSPLPTPDTEISPGPARTVISGLPAMPGAMMIQTSAGKEFHLQLSDNPMTRATFDQSGRATSNRFFVDYSFTLENGAGDMLFSNGTNDTFAPLIAMQDRFLDVRIPLKVLGAERSSPAMEIREVNSLAKILPYEVKPFSQ